MANENDEDKLSNETRFFFTPPTLHQHLQQGLQVAATPGAAMARIRAANIWGRQSMGNLSVDTVQSGGEVRPLPLSNDAPTHH